jgi:hypothetical protein
MADAVTSKSGVILPFDYSQLPEVEGVAVKEAATAIHLHLHNMQERMIEIGDALLEVRGLLVHGQWLSWLKAEFDWSEDSARNYMNAAQRMRDIPNRSEYQQRAIYLLAKRTTPEEARGAAAALAANGEPVDHDAAQILSHILRFPYLVKRFQDKAIAKAQCLATIRALKACSPESMQFAIENEVTHPYVVRGINEAYHRADRERWDDLLRDRALITDKRSVPLSEANERDWQDWIAWRRWCRIQDSITHKDQDNTILLQEVRGVVASGEGNVLTIKLDKPLAHDLPAGLPIIISISTPGGT